MKISRRRWKNRTTRNGNKRSQGKMYHCQSLSWTFQNLKNFNLPTVNKHLTNHQLCDHLHPDEHRQGLKKIPATQVDHQKSPEWLMRQIWIHTGLSLLTNRRTFHYCQAESKNRLDMSRLGHQKVQLNFSGSLIQPDLSILGCLKSRSRKRLRWLKNKQRICWKDVTISILRVSSWSSLSILEFQWLNYLHKRSTDRWTHLSAVWLNFSMSW